ncbi:MAG: MFS transporter [Dehalococcoidia bacterium]|nr:MAG: MFS transporter [Dehalococcoidia bacterium]
MGELAGNSGVRDFRSIDYVKITIFGFALTALWSSLHTIILPLRLLDFVAEPQLNTYLGLLAGSGLILAMVVQPIAGAVSDRSGFRWGRRRPYILLGSILVIMFLFGIGFSGSYVALFAIYCLLQVGSNIAQGAYQAFIPDLAPAEKRGLASGVKGLFEIAGGIVLLRLIVPFMDRYSIGAESLWLWLALGAVAVVLLGAMIATVLTVKERPLAGVPRLPLLPTLTRSFRIDVRKNSDFIWFLLSRLLIFMSLAVIQRFAFYFLKYFVGVANPAAATADLLIVVGIFMLAAVYFAGRLSDRVGRRPIAISSGLLGALGVALLLAPGGYSMVLFAGSVLGIASGAFISTNWALATDMVPKGEEARYLGLTNLATAGGSALALFVIGPVIDLFNTYSPGLGYQVMLGTCIFYFVAGSLLLFKVRAPTQLR